MTTDFVANQQNGDWEMVGDGWTEDEKASKQLTALELHGAGLNIHRKILQVHRTGQDQSQP